MESILVFSCILTDNIKKIALFRVKKVAIKWKLIREL